jgi:hypothetical protein
MEREQVIRMAREAGWSGLYTQWAEPTGKPDWSPFKESLTVPVTMEQIERFAALVAAAERERLLSTEIHSCHADCQRFACVQTRKAVEAEREKVAAWMIERSYATGHGDTTEDLLKEMEWQIREAEREACARACEARYMGDNNREDAEARRCAAAIRARGEKK